MPANAEPAQQDPATPTGSRGRPADPHLQARFIDAALDLLTTRGYRALTTSAVAKHVGASTASLYRRWPTKQALIADLARTIAHGALDSLDTGTLRGDLHALITLKQHLFARTGTAVIALLAESAHDTQLRGILHTEVLEATTQRMRAILDRAADRGEIAPPQEDTAALLGLLIAGGGLLRHALAPMPPPASTIDAEVDMILQVLMALPAPG
ncbi:TetR/AcrR family transcriptional regulator [Okibacterium endophyticum]